MLSYNGQGPPGAPGLTGGSRRVVFLYSLRAPGSPSSELSTQWSEEGTSALLSRVQPVGGQPVGPAQQLLCSVVAVVWAGREEALKGGSDCSRQIQPTSCSCEERPASKRDANLGPQTAATLGSPQCHVEGRIIFSGMLFSPYSFKEPGKKGIVLS